jgi:chromate transporter
LALEFFRIGLGSFGGLPTTIALMEREFVERRGLLTKNELVEAATYTRLLPGSGGPLIVSYVGFQLGGWSYSAIATIFSLLPAFLLMLVLTVGFTNISSLTVVRDAIGGVLAAIVGLQAVSLYRLARNSVTDRATVGIFVVALVGALVVNVNIALIVVLAGLYGMIAFRPGPTTPEAGS